MPSFHSATLSTETGKWWPALAKATLLRLLAQLQHGCLTLEDRGETYTFGDESSDLQAQVIIHDEAVYPRILTGGGTLSAGECYFLGLWDSPDVSKVVRLLVRNRSLLDRLDFGFSGLTQLGHRVMHLFKANTRRGSKKNIAAHYDLGNDFYRLFLDPSMMYSSAMFPQKDTDLQSAQTYKLDAICQRLNLQPGEQVIEIGTGWGGFAIHAATHYGVHVTTTTISEEQHAWAEQAVKQRGLTDKITLLKQDYRDLSGQYDKLVSIEMIEAVGHSHLPTFFATCNRLLKPNGKLLIQAITIADQRYDRYRKQADFIQRYIFPGGFLPSITVMSQSIARHTDMKITALHDIGLDYALTLRHWSERLQAAQHELKQIGLDQQFYRMWQFYFHYCEGGFRERLISTVHLLADKPLHIDQRHVAVQAD